jgi:hypothetical protein
MGPWKKIESTIVRLKRRTFRLEMIKQNEIKVLLMANVHGGNLHHADTEAIKPSRAGALGPI